MKETEIKEYRQNLNKEYLNKELEIETTLSYISIGSLGFFITINREFLKLQTSNNKWTLILSLCFIFISFVLILISKNRTSHYDIIMMEFIDNMKADCRGDDLKLLNLWDKKCNELKKIRMSIYICLSIGIGLQILFLLLNI